MDLYRLATRFAPSEFEHRALALMAQHVGFDGAVWGEGTAVADRVEINRATVVGRSATMVADYARLPVTDPITSRFIRRPMQAQFVCVQTAYRAARLSTVREFLHSHQVGHLMLVGYQDGTIPAQLHWMTVYRSPRDALFNTADVAIFPELLAHWIQAREICCRLHHVPRSQAGEVKHDSTLSTTPKSAQAHGFTNRQRQVLLQLVLGYSYKQIGKNIGLSDLTVKDYARAIYARLGVHNKTEAASQARLRGLLD
jgi:DNA-binding CsgD family transcriptional regulator